nr:NAD(P)/FAD-dependent oxidoreductase [Bacteroidota bacterium]
ARCRRKVVLFDTGKQRNRFTKHLNGYLTRDSISPKKFIEIARKELLAYNVIERFLPVVDAKTDGKTFTVTDADGKKYRCKKLLIATGVVDNLPDIPGFKELYGISVHHCPYCDGFEYSDKSLAVYGKGKKGLTAARNMLNWTKDIVLCTDGAAGLQKEHYAVLERLNIKINKEKIIRLEEKNGRLSRIIFETSPPLERDALFFSTGFKPACDLPVRLKSDTSSNKEVLVDHLQESSVAGLYVCGDAALEMKFVIIAAGEGAKAAIAINVELMKEEYGY